MRTTCSVFVEVDVEKAMKDGLVFYISPNKVILCAGVDKTIDPVKTTPFGHSDQFF